MAQATEIPTRPGQTAATPYNTPYVGHAFPQESKCCPQLLLTHGLRSSALCQFSCLFLFSVCVLCLLLYSATPAPTQMSRPQVPDAVAEGEEEAAAAGPNAGLTREQLLQVRHLCCFTECLVLFCDWLYHPSCSDG